MPCCSVICKVCGPSNAEKFKEAGMWKVPRKHVTFEIPSHSKKRWDKAAAAKKKAMEKQPKGHESTKEWSKKELRGMMQAAVMEVVLEKMFVEAMAWNKSKEDDTDDYSSSESLPELIQQ